MKKRWTTWLVLLCLWRQCSLDNSLVCLLGFRLICAVFAYFGLILGAKQNFVYSYTAINSCLHMCKHCIPWNLPLEVYVRSHTCTHVSAHVKPWEEAEGRNMDRPWHFYTFHVFRNFFDTRVHTRHCAFRDTNPLL